MKIVATKEELLSALDFSKPFNPPNKKQEVNVFIKKGAEIPDDLKDTGNKGILDLVTPGIYFLRDNGNIVYIGESYCIMSRIVTHQKEKKKIFTEFTWLTFCGSPLERKELECRYINAYNPYYNKVHKLNKKRKRKSVDLLLGHKRIN